MRVLLLWRTFCAVAVTSSLSNTCGYDLSSVCAVRDRCRRSHGRLRRPMRSASKRVCDYAGLCCNVNPGGLRGPRRCCYRCRRSHAFNQALEAVEPIGLQHATSRLYRFRDSAFEGYQSMLSSSHVSFAVAHSGLALRFACADLQTSAATTVGFAVQGNSVALAHTSSLCIVQSAYAPYVGDHFCHRSFIQVHTQVPGWLRRQVAIPFLLGGVRSS